MNVQRVFVEFEPFVVPALLDAFVCISKPTMRPFEPRNEIDW